MSSRFHSCPTACLRRTISTGTVLACVCVCACACVCLYVRWNTDRIRCIALVVPRNLISCFAWSPTTHSGIFKGAGLPRSALWRIVCESGKWGVLDPNSRKFVDEMHKNASNCVLNFFKNVHYSRPPGNGRKQKEGGAKIERGKEEG